MSRFRDLRRLGPKLFLSYLLIVVVGSLVLWVTAEAVAPTAFSRHLAAMVQVMGQPVQMMGDLFAAFLRAMNTALAVAATAAFFAAVAVSIFVTRRIVAPVRAMISASTRIAAGRYAERVPVTAPDELGELAGQFNRMAMTLEQVERMRRNLIADVAHELRTPLASIDGYMEALIDGVIPADPETFHRIRREATRLQRLVSDLEELSRAEAGQISVRLVPVEADDLANAAAARMRPQFEDKDIRLSVEVPPGLARVLADPDRIGQVLTNLLGNALQYTPPGGLVTIRAHQEDGVVAIAVADTGIGIAPEHLPHLFDRFYRIDPSRARTSGGSGIGLTIARHLVESHGGEIRAESPGLGRGATFTFTLPPA